MLNLNVCEGYINLVEHLTCSNKHYKIISGIQLYGLVLKSYWFKKDHSWNTEQLLPTKCFLRPSPFKHPSYALLPWYTIYAILPSPNASFTPLYPLSLLPLLLYALYNKRSKTPFVLLSFTPSKLQPLSLLHRFTPLWTDGSKSHLKYNTYVLSLPYWSLYRKDSIFSPINRLTPT